VVPTTTRGIPQQPRLARPSSSWLGCTAARSSQHVCCDGDDVTSRFLDDITIIMMLPPDNGQTTSGLLGDVTKVTSVTSGLHDWLHHDDSGLGSRPRHAHRLRGHLVGPGRASTYEEDLNLSTSSLRYSLQPAKLTRQWFYTINTFHCYQQWCHSHLTLLLTQHPTPMLPKSCYWWWWSTPILQILISCHPW